MKCDVEWEPILRAIAAKLHTKAGLIRGAVITPELLIERCPLCEGHPCDEDCPLVLVRKEILDAAYFTAAVNADRPPGRPS
jgi:hypothetical protein